MNLISKASNYRFTEVAVALLLVMNSVVSLGQAAGEQVPSTVRKSAYEQPAFYALCILAIVLLIYIRQLTKLFASVVSNYAQKHKKNGGNADKALMVITLFGVFQLLPQTSHASSVSDFLHDGFGSTAFNAIAVIVAFELLVIVVLTSILNTFLRKRKQPAPYVEKEKTVPLLDKLNQSISIEQEQDIMMDHDYDGIRELDNNLPPWWKYGFYLTIVFSFVYLAYYHVFAAGPLQLQELEIAEQKAAAALEEYRKYAANQVDESNVVFLSSESDILEGRKLFADKTCISCHGPQGGGGTGPNLTDAYWINGGSAPDIFKSIKYGIPEKGMKSWKNEITPSQMAQIVSYIHSLQGSNPPGAKEPQGDLYTPEDIADEAAADSAAVADTTKQ
jgi:cytochrome c oxidase cbb3-type subunit 3